MNVVRIPLIVVIEMKEEHGAADNTPPLPTTVAEYVRDCAGDVVCRDYYANWMIRSVRVGSLEGETNS